MAMQTVTRNATNRPLGLDSKDGYEVSQPYWVIATTQTDAIAKLGAEEGVTLGSVYRDQYGNTVRNQLTLRSIDVKVIAPHPAGETGMYEVVARYSETKGASTEPVAGGSPVYNWSSIEVTEPSEVDINGNPIRNSSDEVFEKPISIPMQIISITVEWYVSSFSTSQLIEFGNAVNSKSWQGISAGQARISRLTRDEQTNNNEDPLFKIKANIEARKSFTFNSTKIITPTGATVGGSSFPPFMEYVVDQGFRKKTTIDDDGKQMYEQFVDDQGKPLKKAKYLDGSGNEKDADSPVVAIQYQIYPEKDFALLGI